MASKTLPEDFLRMLDTLGLQELGKALAEGEPCTSVRLNRYKGISESDISFSGPAVGWCEAGIYLPERPRFTFDPAFHQGCYYVQEASSMFHAHVVRELIRNSGKPLRVLDSCAAPGGKTTAVIDSLPEGSIVVANEYVPARAAVLRENIIKWGYPSAIVTRGDTAAFRRIKESFDIIVADVPCSGEGMMRKDDEAVAQWSPGLIRECAERQWEIVGNLWPALRPGGVLIYSTCTFNCMENEEIVSRMIEEFGAESVEIPVRTEWGISPGIDTGAHCYRFIPGRVKGEGLFVAVVRKPGENKPEKPSRSSDRKNRNKKGPADEAAAWLSASGREALELYAEDDRISAFPKQHADFLKKVKKEIDVIHEGVLVATVKGRDLIPSQSLALSPYISDTFPRHEISRDEAIAYLSGDAVTLPDSFGRGFVLLTYLRRPLGFVKNIGRRSNNLYPAGWRIKSKAN